MTFERVSTLPVPLCAYPLGLNDSTGTAPPDVDDVAVVAAGVAIVEFVHVVAVEPAAVLAAGGVSVAVPDVPTVATVDIGVL